MTDETPIDERRGRYLRAQQSGQELADAEWLPCDVRITDRRVVIRAEETIELPLEAVDTIGGRYDVNRAARAEAEYLSLHVDEDVVLVTAPAFDALETALFRALLAGGSLHVRHPAVEGGVVRDTEWQRGRPTIAERALSLTTEGGDEVAIERADVTDLATDRTAVDGRERAVVRIEHTNDEGTSVETHLAGREAHLSAVGRLLGEGVRANVDLDAVERRVVVALYAGVSPFEVAEFVGIDVERVEAIYDRLIELDVIEVERERTEVALSARGRTVASEAMGER